MMEILLEYIRPELVILVVALWVLGKFMKLNPKFKDEWKIPYRLLGIGVVMSVLYITIVIGEGFKPSVIISAMIQGVLVSGMAVFGNELIKQWTVKRNV